MQLFQRLVRHPLLRSPWFYLAAIFVLTLTFVNLGSEGIYSAQEGRTAIIARNMLRTGDFIDMKIPGAAVKYEKPIFFYWLVAAAGKPFGLAGDPFEAHHIEFALRLPSALAAVLGVLGAAILAGAIYGRRTALITAVVLSSMSTYNTLGRLAHIDMAQTTACVWAMLFFYLGYLKNRKTNGWIYGFYLMLGVSMLLKGPLVTVIAGLVVVSLMIRCRDWSLPFRLRPWTGGLIFLVSGCGWYVFEYFRTNGAFIDEFILKQNVRRYTGQNSTYRNGEWMSPLYYFQYLAAGAMPWTPVALIGMIARFKQLIRLRIRLESFFLLSWFTVSFVLLTFAALKRGDYLLVAYPALAIMTARAIDLICDHRPKISSWWHLAWIIPGVLLLTLFAVNETGVFVRLGEDIVSRKIAFISKSDGMSILQLSTIVLANRLPALLLILAGTGVFGWLVWLLIRRKTLSAFVLFTALCGVLAVFYHTILDPAISRAKTIKPFCVEVRRVIPPDQSFLYAYNFNTEMLFFIDRDYRVLNFIVENPRDWDQPFLIIKPKEYRALPADKRERLELLARTPERHEYPEMLFRIYPGKAPVPVNIAPK